MRQHKALLRLAGLCLLLCATRPVEASSILQKIPGMGFLQGLAESSIDTISSALDSVFGGGSAEGRALDGADVRPTNESGLPLDPDTHRNVSEIIRSRGFEVEEHEVVTKDGYILTIQRIVNPLVDAKERANLKPVIMQHGLMSSSVDWVINSVNVRPARFPRSQRRSSRIYHSSASVGPEAGSAIGDSQESPNSLGFFMANEGYDVFLANSRGNIYGQRHVNRSSWEPKFWSFTFDEQIKYDLPDTIDYVRRLTGHAKLGYVGHSQGTAMMFGLLADQPQYADIVEPYIALAPVAFVNHSISPVRYFAVYTPIFQHINLWFGTSNEAVKYLAPKVCEPKVLRREICANIFFLSVGFDENELDDSRITAYLSHMPSGTSVKNVAHYGQMVLSGRFAKFDHGIIGNQIEYGQTVAPDYDLRRIRSKSIALFHAENDWLASPKDVARLKAELGSAPFRSFNISESSPKWNHIDFLYGKSCGELVNKKVLQVFDHFGGPKVHKGQ